MDLLLPLTDTAITDCRHHVNQHPDTDPAVVAYLTRYVNGLMCTEIENVVTRLIRARLEIGCSDEATSNFLKSAGRTIVRNAKISEVRGKLALLGIAYKDSFSAELDRTVGEDGIGKLGIAVGKRNENAHDDPPDITFRELEEAYSVATRVVDAVRLTLQV